MNKFSRYVRESIFGAVVSSRGLSAAILLIVSLHAVTLMNGCYEAPNPPGCPAGDNACIGTFPANPADLVGTPPKYLQKGYVYDNRQLAGNLFLARRTPWDAMRVDPLSANAGAISLPTFFLSYPPPLYGLSQTVNFPQTVPSVGAFATPSTPPTTGEQELGIERQADCSFTLNALAGSSSSTSTTSSTFTASQSPDFGNYLHAVAGLPAQTVQFPLGCKGAQLGIASQSYVNVGQDSKGDQIGVGLVSTVGYMVLLANPGSGTVSVTPLPQAVSLGLASLTFNVADVNGDGINDLIAIEESSNSPSTPPGIFVFLGHADGTFANPVEYSAGSGPIAVAIDDVNGDGKLDLIVQNSGLPPNNIQVLLGNGDGTFKTAINAGSTNPLADNMFSVAAGDFNGDGKIDLVLSDGEILLGNGNGTFAASAFTLPMPANSFGNVPVVGDFNHDGNLDVAMNVPNITASSTGEVMIFLGKGDGTFTTGTSYVNISGSEHMATEDFDGDGNLDLIIGSGDNGVYSAGSNTNGVFQFLMGRGDGTFAGAPAYQNVAYINQNPIVPAFAVGDFNGDGKPDILTEAIGGNNYANIQGMVLLAGDGQGNFTQGPIIKGDSPLALVAADMNGDGKLDAVFAGSSASGYSVNVALGNGDGTFQTPTDYPLPGGNFNDMVVGDFNGDGKPDVMVTETSSSTGAGAIELFLGNGDGTLQSPVQVDTPPQAYGIAAGDFNGDGKLDFAVTNTSNGNANTTGAVLVYLNQGSGTFAKPVSYAANMFPGPIAVADVNLDGKPDLVVASSDNAAVTSSNP
ncbi:MAG: FG-GAP repeat domain-containing protein, partial [Candidatus Saccharimonadales bacterium]